MSNYHHAVLLNPSVDALVKDPSGIYVDATFGGGGHSRAILERLNDKGRLISFDRDSDASQNVPDDKRFLLVHHNFSFIKQFLTYYRAIPVQGILADLGISSHQIDEAERGFSHRFDGPLDMRMDRDAKLSADTVINAYTEEQLGNVFYLYGELKNARKIASVIVQARSGKGIHTTEDLKRALFELTPKHTPAKFLSQVYQAIRLEVNGELRALEKMLMQSAEVLSTGGRLVIISYHSLEDRMVKNFMQTGNFQGKRETDLFGKMERPFHPEPTKAIVPDEKEIQDNKRARSAKMRIAIKN
ncbi:MAG: 16S rRNA (cytosine(1402)-N(4))-methyltransferase RsmH [Bacteroidetes bacterium]|nr:16S rRNA (cytosine(1402)-N(4))-methyltransferase RsmH [Bacteroidota bacterium]